jgi:general secretion pathway protein J
VSRPRGFTLLEVMIALTLLSMVMVATITALRTLGNTKASVAQVTDRVDGIRVLSEFLRNTIGAAMPVVRVGSATQELVGGGVYSTYFAGDTTQLVWVAPLVAGADMGGAFVMQLALVEDRLELKWHPYQSDAAAVDWDALESRVLLQSVDEFQVGYLANYGEEWLDFWSASQRIPVAVRLTLRSGERYWPELVIRLSGAELNLR